MSQALKEYAFEANPSLLDDNLGVDPEYLPWAEEYETETVKEQDMKMDEMYASSSNFLKADDLNGKPVKLIIEGIEMHDLDGKEKPVVSFQRAEKQLVLNKTNGMAIASMYGDESDGWIGKEIILFPTKVDYAGKMVDAIRIQQRFEEAFDDDIPF